MNQNSFGAMSGQPAQMISQNSFAHMYGQPSQLTNQNSFASMLGQAVNWSASSSSIETNNSFDNNQPF